MASDNSTILVNLIDAPTCIEQSKDKTKCIDKFNGQKCVKKEEEKIDLDGFGAVRDWCVE